MIDMDAQGTMIDRLLTLLRTSTEVPAGSHEIHPGDPRILSAIDDVVLLNLEGAGMIGVPGIAERLFGTLRVAGVSVVMISQGSSEHSICFTIPSDHAAAARRAIEEAFAPELRQGQIQTLDVTTDCSILAVVGDTDHAG